MAKDKQPADVVNKKAAFNFERIESYKAGMILTGTEVKALREGKANLSDSYCFFKQGELWVKNLHISEYKFGTYANHEPLRLRKLLLQNRELKKLQHSVKEKGLTIIPYRLFFNERNMVKMEIILARGKKVYDKRETIKARDEKKSMDRVKKSFNR
jgi:SsrA-binding protein